MPKGALGNNKKNQKYVQREKRSSKSKKEVQIEKKIKNKETMEEDCSLIVGFSKHCLPRGVFADRCLKKGAFIKGLFAKT